jgi:small subunit ribosomal protein S6e
MAEFKVIISDINNGKSSVKELKDQNAQFLVGSKIGDVLQGSSLGVNGQIKVTGGSDKAGFPMRSDVLGGGKKRILISGGTGFNPSIKGEKIRKLVRGNVITDEIYQINVSLVEGSSVLDSDQKSEDESDEKENVTEAAPAEAAPAEDKPAEDKPAEDKPAEVTDASASSQSPSEEKPSDSDNSNNTKEDNPDVTS